MNFKHYQKPNHENVVLMTGNGSLITNTFIGIVIFIKLLHFEVCKLSRQGKSTML